MNNKDVNLKEKLKQALTSTVRAISGDFEPTDNLDKDENLKRQDSFEIDNLNRSLIDILLIVSKSNLDPASTSFIFLERVSPDKI